MARRKKAAGKAATKAKAAKVANGLVTVPVRKNDSDESCLSQDNSDLPDPVLSQIDELPTDSEQTNAEGPSLQSMIEELAPQSLPISIVHKKFGKFQCVVETESTVIHKGNVANVDVDVDVQEEVSSIDVAENECEEMSEVVWDEEVIEETIVCDEMEVEEESLDPEDQVNKEIYQSAAKHMAFEEEWNSRHPNAQNDMCNAETVISSDRAIYNQEIVKDADICIRPSVAASSQPESFSKISVTNHSDKEPGVSKLKNEEYDATSTSESEVTSREEDSQDSQKMSGSDQEGFPNQTDEELKKSCAKIILGISNENCSEDSTLLLKDNLTEPVEESKLVEDKRHLRSSSRPNKAHQLMGPTLKSQSPKVKKKTLQAIALATAVEESPGNTCETPSSSYRNQQMTVLSGIHSLGLPPMVDSHQDEELQQSEEPTEELKENIESVENDALIQSAEPISVNEPKMLKPIEEEVESKSQTPAFRSRSGSTDTTGSESSCSSNIRRSTRIRSISITKQRTRSRFEALSISSEDPKVTESRDSSDNNSGAETQSDRESISLKVPVPMSLQGISAPLGIRHLDLNFKPVKVKSRWRRSSELEMVGNRSSDSDVAATPPTPSHSPLLIAPRTPTMSPRLPTCPAANASVASPTPAPMPTPMTVDDSPIVEEVMPKKDARNDKKVREDKEMEERLRQFENLTENNYLTDRSTSKEFRGMVCDCFLTKDEVARGELGCGEDCLNRLLMIECGSRCTLGDRCSNKHFQKQEYSKCEVFKTEKKGFGLRATADLPQGAFLLEYVGEVVNAKEFRRRAKEYSKDKNRHYYFMALKSDSIIDATMKGNISRFINHSCDPNAETQKWTVNGELRIGFFTTRSLAAWEELTFDYQFQRYGKEAQRCHCESSLCRGWIGEDPEKEKEKEDLAEKKDRDASKRNKFAVEVEVEEEDSDEIDDTLEEDIEKLCRSGLKNRAHTLTLCRLMVRSQDAESRVRLLQLLQRGEQACLRLFLDYHGLRLIWKWMSDVGRGTDGIKLRTEILRTLSKLPILNKTVLQDSKVLSVVEKWVEPSSSGGDGSAVCHPAEPMQEGASPEGSQDSEQREAEAVADSEIADAKPDLAATQEFTALGVALLAVWSALKEAFRIPKKERIEQMKEHEREADRGYKEYLDKEGSRSNKQSYDRHWRQRSADNDKARDRKKIVTDTEKIRKSRFEDRCIVQMAGLSKEERRQMFAEKVAKEEEEERQRKLVEEEEERLRRNQEEHWRIHEEQCRALDVDPMTTAFDWDTGCMAVFDPAAAAWVQYPPQVSDQPGAQPSDPGAGQLYDQRIPINAEFDPNHPMHAQFNVGHPQFDPNNPVNSQLNPDLMNQQFNPNLAHPQFSPLNAQFNPANTTFNPNFNHPGQLQFNPNNPMHPQFNPNDMSNQFMPPQYDPNNPMAGQFNPNMSDSPHLPHAMQGDPSASMCYDPNVSHPSQILIPQDSVDLGVQFAPTNPNLIPVPLTADLGPTITAQPEVVYPPLPPDLEQIPLPGKWMSAKDDRGFTYYYHKIDRIARWEPPWEFVEEAAVDPAGAEPDADSTSDLSDEDEDEDLESPGEEEEDPGQEVVREEETAGEGGLDKDELGKRKEVADDEIASRHRSKKKKQALVQYHIIEDNIVVDEGSNGEEEEEGLPEGGEESALLDEGVEASVEGDILALPSTPEQEMSRLEIGDEIDEEQPTVAFQPEEVKKRERREGLVQERIISPRCEADRPAKKNYRIIKEKLRRKKDQARKARSKKKRHDREGKPHASRKAEKPVQVDATDTSTEAARKIKDHFRLQMAGAMVQFLNPYRKPDCIQGRITNTEDFKHLARKLTLFVMLKELKHCRSVDDLVCNDSVKHKARDFIRKYMSKFGTLYQRPIDDD